MRTRYWFIVFLAMLGSSCSNSSEKKGASPDESEIVRPDTPLVLREIIGLARIEPPEKIISLQAETAGYVREVRFTEGSRVQKGDPLVLLSSDLEQAQLRQAQSKLETQRAAIRSAEASLESLKVKLANARNTYARLQRLAAGNAATAQQTDDSRFAVEDLEKQLASQQAVIAREQSRLKELEADAQYYKTLLDLRTLHAPLSGTFLSSGIKPGQYVNTATTLGEFALDGPYIAVAEIDELFADKVREGQRAYLRMQGASERIATGEVIYAAPYLKQKSLFSDSPDNLEDRRVREVRVRLDANKGLLIGSRVECVIETGAR